MQATSCLRFIQKRNSARACITLDDLALMLTETHMQMRLAQLKL